MIQTVLGGLPPNNITHAQCHEHLFIEKGKSYEINPSLCIDDWYKTYAELKKYKFSGGSLVVDAQPIGCGRMEVELSAVSKKSGVDIIASTGFHKLMFYPENHWIHSLHTDDFAEIMITELTDGMYTGCNANQPLVQIKNKAGMIKMAVDKQGLDKSYKRFFNAGIKAGVETKAPVQCHIEKAEQGEKVGKYLLSGGLEKEQIILAHMDRDATKREEIYAVADLGVFMEFDTIGRFKYHSDQDEVDLIKDLIKRGHLHQLLIGLDTTRARLKSYNGQIGLDYILEEFIPFMEAQGITKEEIFTIIVENPKKALAFLEE